MNTPKIKTYTSSIPSGKKYVLAGDIGGTNSNFGLCSLDNDTVTLHVSYHVKSKLVADYATLIKEVLDYFSTIYKIQIKHACLAAAGVPEDDNMRIKPTNLSVIIDARTIKNNTYLSTVLLANDFNVIGIGINYINPKNLITVKKGSAHPRATKAIMGAGTGLGKAILFWDKHATSYSSLSSEGGHADFPAQTKIAQKVITFMQETEQITCPISWEHVLSGGGIARIYKFLETQKEYHLTDIKQSIRKNGYQPDEIFAHWQLDQHCNDTFIFYASLYGTCAKNFSLETLALGGFYIAGGIAANNLPLFEQQAFQDAFTACGKQADLVQLIPIVVIADYNVSLFGAAAYLKNHLKETSASESNR